MKTYAFLLSGEHDTLPKSEALALLGIFSTRFNELYLLDRCLIIQADHLDVVSLGSRLAMTHSVIEVLAICDSRIESLAEAAREMDIPIQRYRIRAKRLQRAVLFGVEAERVVGRELLKRGFKVDLKNPKLDLKAIITEGKIILGIEIAQPDRGAFEARRPHLKPYFHPGVLMPRMARALVNISQVRYGDWILDPFSGTAGILVEACLVGIKGVGIDVQRMLIRGARTNLDGLDCSLIIGDAKRLPIASSSIDSVVLDMPYGKSAIIEAESKEALLNESIAELFRIIKPGRRIVIVADQSIEFQAETAGFKIIERHEDRVHRSLTRHIIVCYR
jgi:tRNA (guanine10-N2)-dimethyltransferase